MRLVPMFLLAGCVSGKPDVDLVEGTGWRREISIDCILVYDQVWEPSEVPCDDCEFVADISWYIDEGSSSTTTCGTFYAEKHETVGYRLDIRATNMEGFWVSEDGSASWIDGTWLFKDEDKLWDTESSIVVDMVYETATFYGE